MGKADVERFFTLLAKDRPDPSTELDFLNPYTLLVAVVLSAQATDVGVNKATERLFKIADSPQKMLDLGETRLIEHIRTIGLFRTKAKNVIALSRLLIEQHGGKVPGTREALEALPGVGRKTANVVLNVAFGQPTIAVDTHIFRVGNRTGLAPGKTPLLVEEALERVVPARFKHGAHHWLILHGRYVCVARKPRCEACVVNALCAYPAKTVEAAAAPPVTRGRARPASRKVPAAAPPPSAPRGPRRARKSAGSRRGA
jgi:endonuclease III